MVRIRLILTLCCSFISIAALQAQPLYVGEFNIRNDNAEALETIKAGKEGVVVHKQRLPSDHYPVGIHLKFK